jgi:hypothetical protein
MVMAGMAGCTSTGIHKSDNAAKNLRLAAEDIQIESRHLETTMDALNALVNQPAADLKPQYDRFSSALDRLVASTERVAKTGRAMNQKNAAYMAEWDKQIAGINYQVIRLRSEERRREVHSQLDAVDRRYHDARVALQPLVHYLEDIRKALQADLTVEGLEAIKPVAANANANAQKVQVALGNLTTELTASSMRLSSINQQKTTGSSGSSQGIVTVERAEGGNSPAPPR